MKVLKNYKPLNEKIEEFPCVKIMDNEDVLLDLPLCVIEFGSQLKNAVLSGMHKGIPLAVEADDIKETLNKTKLFYLKRDGDKVEETTKENADLIYRLPKETIVEQLMIKDNELIWAKPQEVEEGDDE